MKKSIHTPEYKKFVRLLVAARKRAKLSQIQLAKLLDRPKSVVASIEIGQRRVDIIEFLEIARHLKIDPHEIIDALNRKQPSHK